MCGCACRCACARMCMNNCVYKKAGTWVSLLLNQACQSTPGDRSRACWVVKVIHLCPSFHSSPLLKSHMVGIEKYPCVCERESTTSFKRLCVHSMYGSDCHWSQKGHQGVVLLCGHSIYVRLSLPCRFGRRGWKHLFHKQTRCHRFAAEGLWWNCDTHPSEERKRRMLVHGDVCVFFNEHFHTETEN